MGLFGFGREKPRTPAQIVATVDLVRGMVCELGRDDDRAAIERRLGTPTKTEKTGLLYEQIGLHFNVEKTGPMTAFSIFFTPSILPHWTWSNRRNVAPTEADVIALLARTDEDTSKGSRGLSLFIVDKPRFLGHEFTATQPGGGMLTGKADRTPGYRGMHSFTLSFDKWLVPDAQLVGGPAGLGRGFGLQMAGFVAGRLQTGGRACGVTQAAVEATARYVAERKQFGRAIGEYGLSLIHIFIFNLGGKVATFHRPATFDAEGFRWTLRRPCC